MRRFVGGAVLLLAFLPALWAQDDKKPDAKTPAEELKAIRDEFDKKFSDLRTAFTAEQDQAKKQAISDQARAMTRAYEKRFLALAQKNPKDRVAVDAISWTMARGIKGPDFEAGAEILLKHHTDKLSTVAPFLARSTSNTAEKLLKANVEASKEPSTIAQAKLQLAKFHKNLADSWEPVEGRDPAKAAAEAEKLLTEIVTKYADAANVLKLAKPDLEEIQKLSVGKTVPEIEAEDLDGKKFKLSDYRGKVVLIDFWGHW